MKAVCVRCGVEKDHFTQVCTACGNRPDGDGLLVAWIASEENLDGAALLALSKRVARGEALRPSRAMLYKARKALGREISTDAGLSIVQRVALLACSLLITPLVGWTCFFWWRSDRPRAAWQALGLSLPPTVLFTCIWIYAILNGVH